jgi:hypothetical protein
LNLADLQTSPEEEGLEFVDEDEEVLEEEQGTQPEGI